MFWADIIASNIKKNHKHLVNDSKTPSGRVHVGALRGVLIHDFVHKALLEQKIDSRYIYGFDDFDPMDGLPIYLDQEKYAKYMGMPLKDIPAPEGKGNFAEYYANEFLNVFNSLGANPEIYWTASLYKEGKFDEAIKIVLDNADKIQEIYHQVSGSQKKEGWLPFQPVCTNCGKIGTTQAFAWDGIEVSFRCEPTLVKWAQGCGFEGRVSPFGGTGKMPWKVEWPAKWFVFGVSAEGAGKDHSSAGGSRDVGSHIARDIFGIEPPFDVAYEHILIGGRKMSSSKGWGSSAKEVSELLPPEILRFLFARIPYQRAINFDPSDQKTIPDLFDEFDRGEKAYFEKSNPDLAKTWEVSQIGDIKEEFNLRFNLIKELLTNLKSEEDILKEAEKLKGSNLTTFDIQAIKLRIKYVKIWLEKFENKEEDEKVSLTSSQKSFLQHLAQSLPDNTTEDDLQNFIYNKGKELGLVPKESFQAVYVALLGKTQGPKAASVVLSLGLEQAKEKMLEASK